MIRFQATTDLFRWALWTADYLQLGVKDSGGMTDHCPCPIEKGATEAEEPFYKSIIGNFMVYQDQLEINLFQLLAHPENSEWFFIISVIIFEINNVVEQKQAELVNFFCFLLLFIALDSFTDPFTL